LGPLACSDAELISETVYHLIHFGTTPWTGDQPIAWALPTQDSRTQQNTSMPWAGVEPTIPVAERSRTARPLRPAPLFLLMKLQHCSDFNHTFLAPCYFTPLYQLLWMSHYRVTADELGVIWQKVAFSCPGFEHGTSRIRDGHLCWPTGIQRGDRRGDLFLEYLYVLFNWVHCSRVLWEADSHSASREVPRLSRNPKVHCRVHNSLLLVPILSLSQMNPIHTFPPYFPKIHSNIILPSTSVSFAWSFPFRLSDQNAVCVSHIFHACYMHRPSHSMLCWGVH